MTTRSRLGAKIDAAQAALDAMGPSAASKGKLGGKLPAYGPNGEPLNRAARRTRKRIEKKLRP